MGRKYHPSSGFMPHFNPQVLDLFFYHKKEHRPGEEELKDISGWMHHEQEIRSGWNLDKYIRPGYRGLFYGPPGTGKTLAASLLGKQHGADVYRIDLSVITLGNPVDAVKTIAEIYRVAEEKNRILFFSEADRLFGTNNSPASGYGLQISQEILSCFSGLKIFPG